MFDEIEFDRIKRLPKYVFAEVNDLKMAERRAGADVIDFSMGNPDGDTPEHIREKLVESAQKTKTHGYSTSKGIPKLLMAISDWYKRRYDCDLDPMTECVATMGSKEGYAHLCYAITNPGDVAVVPDPTYPIHSYAFILAGGNVVKFGLEFDEDYKIDEDKFLEDLARVFKESSPRPKYVLVNFPHNPTTATVTLDFYKRLVAMAKKERFYIISDIAYGDITFDGYITPSIMEVEGAKDVAVESFTLSKSYNMAGWRVGFAVGGAEVIATLGRVKSNVDFSLFGGIQMAAVEALTGSQQICADNRALYEHRRDLMVEGYRELGWDVPSPPATMYIWARIPAAWGNDDFAFITEGGAATIRWSRPANMDVHHYVRVEDLQWPP